ncbi:hypothetical protein [Pengzhenrongella sp.]|jgi:hypothetical protein|uniref:hypothetical protein n=1 Tax=Pengzhenrongella sp. TaxID=2888820 RepID=UPI002F95573B
MAIGRQAHRLQQLPRVQAEFPNHVDTVVQILDLFDLAWHDCYGEVNPPESVIDDIFVTAGGDLALLIDATHLAVQDWRDLKVRADQSRQLG